MIALYHEIIKRKWLLVLQDKVREEINDVVGNDDVETEHLKDLKYMEMVIKETIRLYPIGPVLQRFATGDITLGNTDKCINVI